MVKPDVDLLFIEYTTNDFPEVRTGGLRGVHIFIGLKKSLTVDTLCLHGRGSFRADRGPKTKNCMVIKKHNLLGPTVGTPGDLDPAYLNRAPRTAMGSPSSGAHVLSTQYGARG
jgi:hypothetical protein